LYIKRNLVIFASLQKIKKNCETGSGPRIGIPDYKENTAGDKDSDSENDAVEFKKATQYF
jgi:hypothetical protein